MKIIIEPKQGVKLYTQIIQKAIDSCSENGGGTVVFTKGQYETGTIFLKSNVKIFLEHSAEILGSTNPDDYPANVYKQMYKKETHMDRCLFFADNCENIELDGYGIINGQGKTMTKVRPMLFKYYQSKNIRVKNLRLIAPASWTNAFIECENIWVQGVDIFSRANNNGDGTDFDACKNVFVSDCKFDCSDDCICLQNSTLDVACENIVVTNCLFKSRWAGMRIGLLSCAPIRNMTVSNCIFREIDCSGLKIQSAEGSIIENMTFSNLIMENVVRPILITANAFRERVGWDEDIKTASIVKNMKFQNIITTTLDENFLKGKETQPKCITIDCDEGHIIENVKLDNIYMKVKGDTSYIEREIPHHLHVRAEGFNYKGVLPAYGLYARNAQKITVTDFEVEVVGNETREKIVFDNIK
ncbi:MAG: glycosyl hydrolase family 28 protein [Clostridia bacterium]